MQELYFLMKLMSSNNSAGKKSFEDFRTVLDIPYDTYRETCVPLGFLDDDNGWDLVMTESAAYDVPSQMNEGHLCYLTRLDILRVYLIRIGGQWANILCTG
jgi:hypothetical protein